MTATKVRGNENGAIHSGSAAGPWWRPFVEAIDGAVTPSANRLVRTNVFADVVAATTRLEVRLRRRIVRQSTWLLHQYNVPAAEDVRKLRAQLATAEARLRDVSERLEDDERAAKPARRAPSKPRPAAGKPTSSARKRKPQPGRAGSAEVGE